jgi:transcriptional regulator with XRE-family HTH domain
MTERTAFAAELRRARERRGLSLDAIAEQTKVSATLYAGLERADLSRWPSGIFGRAFIRNYALAVGLDPGDTVARFSRLFGDSAEGSSPAKPIAFPRPTKVAEAANAECAPALAAVEDAPALRLVLDQARPAKTPVHTAAARRLSSGLLDISIAVTPAALVALAVGAQWFWPVVACLSMTGHLACYAAIGTTPGAWVLARFAGPQPPAGSARVERRRADADAGAVPRRRVPRHQSTRQVPHVQRVRH